MEGQDPHSTLYEDLSPRNFRVLHLLPGSQADPIQTRLETVSLDNPGPYKALSYVWGNTTHNQQIIECNGKELKVTANLAVALRRFRHITDPVRMWIDALCINQASMTERSHQIKRMTEIYRKAEGVLMWVAEECVNGDPELTFRIASSRSYYQFLNRPLTEAEGDTPVILVSDDVESMDEILAVQHKYNPITIPESVDGILSEVEKMPLKAIYIGSKRLEGYYPIHGTYLGPILILNIQIERKQLVKALKSEYSTFGVFLEEALKPKEWYLSEEEKRKVLDTLMDLGYQTYFHRAWIVQEILMADQATLCWGEHEADFTQFSQIYAAQNSFQKGVKLFVHEDLVPSLVTGDGPDWIKDLMRDSSKESRTWAIVPMICSDRLSLIYKAYGQNTMSKLLQSYSGQEATDPRDVFFSLFGIVQEYSDNLDERQWCQNVMDYSLDYRALLIRVATHLAVTYQRRDDMAMHILDFFQPGSTRKDITLPTWVPEWPISKMATRTIGPLPDWKYPERLTFGARVQAESLFLKVKIIGIVQLISDFDHVLDKKGMMMEMYIYDEYTRNAKGNPYGTKQKRSRAFWLTTIMADQWADSFITEVDPKDRTEEWVSCCQSKYEEIQSLWGKYAHYRPCLEYALEIFNELFERVRIEERFMWFTIAAGMWIMVEFGLDAIPPKEELAHILSGELVLRMDWKPSTFEVSLSGKHLIQTMSGYFGLATSGVMAGDVVVFVPGSPILWCLRPRGRYYTVASKSCVYGVSNRVDGLNNHWDEKDMVEVELR